MRVIKWISSEGWKYRMEIEDGSEEVRQMSGSGSPFVTSVDDSDDFFEPIRVSTGSIGIVGEVSDLEGMITGVPADRGVELMRIEDNGQATVVWRGFLQTTAFSQAWNRGPIGFAVPVVSGLGVMDSFYLNSDKVSGSMSFAEFLVAMNGAVEGRRLWDGFAFPVSCAPDVTLRYRFQKRNYGTWDEAQERWHMDSYRDVLEDICKLFGWQCQEWGGRLVFVTADVAGGYSVVSADGLAEVAYGGEADWELVADEVVTEEIWGMDHQLDYIDGKKSMEVVGNVGSETEDLWTMDLESMGVSSTHEYQDKDNDVLERNDRRYFCVIYEKGNGITTLEPSGNFRLENWRLGEDRYSGVAIVRDRMQKGNYIFDEFKADEDSGWANRLLMKTRGMEAGRVLFSIDCSAVIPSNWLTQDNKRLLGVSGRISRADSYDGKFESFDGQIGLRVYVGDDDITGATALVDVVGGDLQGWRFSEVNFKGALYAVLNSRGSVRVEIVNEGLDGDKYYSIDELSVRWVNNWTTMIASDLVKDENKAKKMNSGSGFRSEYKVSCGLTTMKEGQSGKGIVLGADEGETPPADLHGGSGRPEEVLAGRLYDYYRKSRRRLTVELKGRGEMMSPLVLHKFAGSGERGMACMAQTVDWREDSVRAVMFEV